MHLAIIYKFQYSGKLNFIGRSMHWDWSVLDTRLAVAGIYIRSRGEWL